MSKVTKLAERLESEYDAKSARYDGVMLHNKCVANTLETIIAILMVLIGTGGVTGLFSTIATFDDSTDAMTIATTVGSTVVSIAFAVLVAYDKVMDPRGKQQMYAASSDACASMVAAARAVTRVKHTSNQSVVNVENVLISTLTALETSLSDNLPPLNPASKKHV